jgi:hypothetical protein
LKFTFPSSIQTSRISESPIAPAERFDSDAGRIIDLSEEQLEKVPVPIEVRLEHDSIPIWEKVLQLEKHDSEIHSTDAGR